GAVPALARRAKKVRPGRNPCCGAPLSGVRRRRRPPDLRPAHAGLSPPRLILDDATSAGSKGPAFSFAPGAGQRAGRGHDASPQRKRSEITMARVNRQWVLRQRPKGLVQSGDLELVEAPVPALNESEVLVRTIYLSLDPTNRTWMNDSEGYLPPVPLGGVMRGLTLGVVEESRSSRFRAGD